jgi:hypothetical protein
MGCRLSDSRLEILTGTPPRKGSFESGPVCETGRRGQEVRAERAGPARSALEDSS